MAQYITNKRIQLQKTTNGKTEMEWREPGQPIPEAAGWRNLNTWISAGRISVVSESAIKAAAKAPVKAPSAESFDDEAAKVVEKKSKKKG